MAPVGRNFGRGGSRPQEDLEGNKNEHEDFVNDKPTDPPESEKLKLIEASKSDFFKRKRIELTNLPNDPRPEVCNFKINLIMILEIAFMKLIKYNPSASIACTMVSINNFLFR